MSGEKVAVFGGIGHLQVFVWSHFQNELTGLEPSVELVIFLLSFNSSISAVHQFNAIKVKTELVLETV